MPKAERAKAEGKARIGGSGFAGCLGALKFRLAERAPSQRNWVGHPNDSEP